MSNRRQVLVIGFFAASLAGCGSEGVATGDEAGTANSEIKSMQTVESMADEARTSAAEPIAGVDAMTKEAVDATEHALRALEEQAEDLIKQADEIIDQTDQADQPDRAFDTTWKPESGPRARLIEFRVKEKLGIDM